MAIPKKKQYQTKKSSLDIQSIQKLLDDGVSILFVIVTRRRFR